MTGFMLDTDISSYIIKRRPATLVEKFEKHGQTLNVSVITAAELRFGAEKAARPKLVELVEAYLEVGPRASLQPTPYGTAILRNASIEYFPAPVMYNSKKPPIMLRFL